MSEINSFYIDKSNGLILINNQYGLIPGLMAEDFLNSEIYKKFSLDQTTLEELSYLNQVILKVKNCINQDWYIALSFKRLLLSTVKFYIVRNSIDEIISETENDICFFKNILSRFFNESPHGPKIAYKFTWGKVHIGTPPDGFLTKIIVRYDLLNQKPKLQIIYMKY